MHGAFEKASLHLGVKAKQSSVTFGILSVLGFCTHKKRGPAAAAPVYLVSFILTSNDVPRFGSCDAAIQTPRLHNVAMNNIILVNVLSVSNLGNLTITKNHGCIK